MHGGHTLLIHLSSKSGESLHHQLSRQLRGLILAGDLQPGQGLESIRALARNHRISTITVRRAYDDLEREGLIHAHRGKGYFVAELPRQEKLDMIYQRLETQLRPILAQAIEQGLSARELMDFIAKQLGEKE